MRHYPKFLNNLSFVFSSFRTKPYLILSTLRFFLLRVIGKPVVRGMDIAITYDCNLRCPHCNISTQHNSDRQELDDRTVISAIQQLRKSGGFYVTFTGGEVLLYLDRIAGIVSDVGRNTMLYQVQTNGTLLNDSTCRRLKQIGIDNVQISFDTYHEDRTWNDVILKKRDQIRLAKKYGLGIFFTWLASHDSLSSHEASDIIRFSNRHKVKIGLNFAVPQGRWSENRSMLLSENDSLRVRKMSRENPYLYTDLQNNLMHYGCPAFSERFHINAYGDVQPCTFFQISFGNIKHEPLEMILKRGREHPIFKGFPDHCPPAENKTYIDTLTKQAFESFPVPYKTFNQFSGYPDTSENCVVCREPVNIPFLSGLREVEYGIPWTGTLKMCIGCGLIQQNPMLSDTKALSLYPDGYIHYNPQPGGIKGFLMFLYMNRTVSLLKNLNVEKGKTLLDIGCGAGEKLAVLKKRTGLSVTGVEPDREAAFKAAGMFGLNVRNSTFSADMFQPDSFDYVRINHVIEHVSDPVKLLNDIHTVLKPGGYLIGETENINCLSFRLFGRYWALLHLPYHLLLFSKQTLTSVFEHSRFGSVTIRDSGDPPAWSLSLQNFLRRNRDINNRKSSRMKGYILLTLLSVPFTWFEQISGNGPVTEFYSIKATKEA